MAESGEPSIKLFGKTISLQPIRESPPVSDGSGEEKDHKEEGTPENMDQHHESPYSEEKSDPPTSTASETDQPSANQEDTTRVDSKPKQQSNETSNSQEKAPKKPNKIFSCPRCNSPDTKFCYYNNYNTNQPRYFCKNCRRYWTAGGTMRNVPMGAGRRKNKKSISYYRHMTMLDATLQAVGSHAMETIHHPPLEPNGIVFSFCSDIPPLESMTSILNPAEKTMKNCTQNRYHQMEEKLVPLSCREENGYEHSSGSSVMTSNSKQEVAKTNLQGVPAPVPYFDGTPWSNQWSMATPFCTSSFAIPSCPDTAYWSCAVSGSRSIPWLSHLASSYDSGFTGSGPNSPTLAKHLRDGNVLKGSNVEKEDHLKKIDQERCIWVPKTSRIDDPDEAAKSSMWAMKLQS